MFNFLNNDAFGPITDKTGLAEVNNLSEHNLVAPYKFMGLAALSVEIKIISQEFFNARFCLLYTSPSPRDQRGSGMAG